VYGLWITQPVVETPVKKEFLKFLVFRFLKFFNFDFFEALKKAYGLRLFRII